MNGAVEPLLRLASVTRRFGGLTAVDGVTFVVDAGEVVGLIGPNGAGKSTVVNLISGLDVPTDGDIAFLGRSLRGVPAHQRSRMGIARTFQTGRPLTGMTVRENVEVAAMFGNVQGGGSARQRAEVVDEALETVGLAPKQQRSVAELTAADRKALELGRALATRPRLLLLDEVMAALDPRELDDKVRVLARLKERGVTMLIIEHVMRVVMSLSDRVVVLHHGKLIADAEPSRVVQDPDVITAYLGEPQTDGGS